MCRKLYNVFLDSYPGTDEYLFSVYAENKLEAQAIARKLYCNCSVTSVYASEPEIRERNNANADSQ